MNSWYLHDAGADLVAVDRDRRWIGHAGADRPRRTWWRRPSTGPVDLPLELPVDPPLDLPLELAVDPPVKLPVDPPDAPELAPTG
jgi:hypothetical protein